jgi:hypothetical protein
MSIGIGCANDNLQLVHSTKRLNQSIIGVTGWSVGNSLDLGRFDRDFCFEAGGVTLRSRGTRSARNWLLICGL